MENRRNMYKPYCVPISIKGIVIKDNKVWLRKNQRNEWELPGGKLDEGEQPEQTLSREIEEELGYEIEIVDIIQSYLYVIESSDDEKKGVLVVSYLCKPIRKVSDFEIHGEMGKSEFKQFKLDEIDGLNMPQFYKDAINKCHGR